jgi:hypothetical protein
MIASRSVSGTSDASRGATGHARGEAPDGERLLAQIVGAAPEEDGQLWALHRAIEATVALPLDVHVVGEPWCSPRSSTTATHGGAWSPAAVAKTGASTASGLQTRRCPRGRPGARHVAAYRAWVGIVPDAGAPATAPRVREHVR